MSDLNEKIMAFLEWYRQLYGEIIYASPVPTSREKPPGELQMPPALSPLQKFHEEIKECQKCPLGKSRTNFVFGIGNEQADIMFVGEAPGRDEDLKGEPFVGRAGQLLNKLLSHIHLKREDVYIANILKCRPPNNRDPLPEEVVQCIPYLKVQIEMIKPRLLVALGRVAAQNLLNTKMPLGKMRQRLWEYQGIPLLVTYHPAAILRNNNLLTDAIADFRKIKELVEASTDSLSET